MRGLLRRRAVARKSDALQTSRLELVAIVPSMLEAEAEGPDALGRALGATVPADWPPELWEPSVYTHIALELVTHPETAGWHRYILLRGEPPRVVGSVGAFPRAAGEVELGYSVVASAQRQGIATEAVNAHLRWLLQQPAVRSVCAQAYLSRPQSIRVMERCGMLPAGAGDEPDTVRYRRFR